MKTILGYYGYGNCGDEALKEATANIFGILPYTTPTQKTPLEEVIMGGGDVINPFFLDRVKDAKDVKILGVGLSYESQLDLLRKMPNLSEIFFRNKVDVDAAVAAGLNAKYTPDIAFTLDLPIKSFPQDKKKKTLGIMVADNISHSFSQKDPQQIHYGNYLKNELAVVLNDLRDYYHVVFIPMCHARYSYDVKMMYEILSFLPSSSVVEHTVMAHDMTPTKVIQLVSELDLVITMRFHGLIFSTLAGTPFINIGVTRKTKTYMHENALGDLSVEPFTLTRENLLDKIKLAEDPLTKIRIENCRDVNRQTVQEVKAYVQKEWLHS